MSCARSLVTLEKLHRTVKANTAEETEALIRELPDGAILAYSDGGCDGNGAKGIWGKAGWGVWICRKGKLLALA